MRFTVFGGTGFIGKALVSYLRSRGREVQVPSRSADEVLGQNLGHVIYAIGLTADFRLRPFDTIDAHVTCLARLMKSCSFDSWLYLSSTRIYQGLGRGTLATESLSIPILPNADSLYDLSKLLGEALCMRHSSSAVRVARLANVYGADQSADGFLAQLLRELRRTGRVEIKESPDSAKDYVSIADVVTILEKIALSGGHRTYNVASGVLVSHARLAEKLAEITGGTIAFSAGGSCRASPLVDVSRIVTEFGIKPSALLDEVGAVFRLDYAEALSEKRLREKSND